jgi:hypothetical protein
LSPASREDLIIATCTAPISRAGFDFRGNPVAEQLCGRTAPLLIRWRVKGGTLVGHACNEAHAKVLRALLTAQTAGSATPYAPPVTEHGPRARQGAEAASSRGLVGYRPKV